MERSKPEFHRSRWLEAIWEPGARIYSLPGGIDMIDISGDGDARLITADLGNSIHDTARVCPFLVFTSLLASFPFPVTFFS